MSKPKNPNRINTLPTLSMIDTKGKKVKTPETIAIVSYPNSGDDRLREYMEKVMGIQVGNDSKLNSHNDKRFHLVNSHFPE